jgi:hypothetical protein
MADAGWDDGAQRADGDAELEPVLYAEPVHQVDTRTVVSQLPVTATARPSTTVHATACTRPVAADAAIDAAIRTSGCSTSA